MSEAARTLSGSNSETLNPWDRASVFNNEHRKLKQTRAKVTVLISMFRIAKCIMKSADDD